MPVKKKIAAKKKVSAPKKKAKKAPVKSKVISVKPLQKSVSKPADAKPTKHKRVQTGTGWRRMMIKAKAAEKAKK